MPIYTEVLHRYSRGGHDYILDVYTQPLPQRLIAEAYRHWWKITTPIMLRLERPLRRRHERRCDGSCHFGVTKEGERVPVCGYMPLSNRQDCRLFALGQRGRLHISETVVDDEIAAELRIVRHGKRLR